MEISANDRELSPPYAISPFKFNPLALTCCFGLKR